MRKTALLFLAIVLTLAAPNLWAEASDVVVLVDTSESVFGFFESIVDYVVTHVANGYLLQGDTFHLLTFSETSQLELSQEISEEDSIRSVVSRLFLLLPFGKKTDILSALSYLDQYVSALGERKTKRILIITDGIHNAPSGSPYAGISQESVLNAIDELTASMIAKGWKISLIRVPFEAEPGSRDPSADNRNADSFMNRLAEGLRVKAVTFNPSDPEQVARDSLSLPDASYPGYLGKKAESFSFPVQIRNSSSSGIRLELRQVLASDQDILDKPSFLALSPGATGSLKVRVTLPRELKNGLIDLPIKLIFADAQRVSPSGTTLSLTLSRNPLNAFFQRSLTVILFIVILLAILALVAFILWTIAGMSSMSRASVVKTAKGATHESSVHATQQNAPPANRAYAGATTSSGSVPNIGAQQKSSIHTRAAVKDDKLLDVSGKEVLSDGYVIPIRLKEKVVISKEPSKAKVEAERRRAERLAEADARRREANLSASLRTIKDASTQLQMIVAEQNPAIGLRNVHHMKAGAQLHVGGSHLADFLVFVVRVPSKIATVHWDGEKLTFLPIRMDYFPGLEGPITDCIGKKISAVSPEGFRMSICFEPWINPLEREKMLRPL